MESGDRFGRALATGNLDGDGFEDLVVGIPLEDDIATDDGALIVFYGSSSGLLPERTELLRQADAGGAAESGDRFASALAIGDFNGDCLGDLAASVPAEDLGPATDAGAVLLQYGTAAGLLALPRARTTGDVDCDGCVDYDDRQAVLSGLSAPNQCGNDVNGDRMVDQADLDAQLLFCGGEGCPATCIDGDCDGYGQAGASDCALGTLLDCDDGQVDVYATPGPAGELQVDLMGSDLVLSWAAPADPGGDFAGVVYDMLRTGLASDFDSSTSCIETDDGLDTSALDGATPAPGAIFNYLVRPGNTCGDGTLGVDADGIVRSGRTCP